MKRKRWKRVLAALGAAALLFGVYNLWWYFQVYAPYKPYTEGFSVFEEGVSYYWNPEDGFLYNVKLPDYLRWTGNLCIATRDNNNALLIWPGRTRETEYGLDLDGVQFRVRVTEDMEPLDSAYQGLVDEHREIDDRLLKRANEVWDLADL